MGSDCSMYTFCFGLILENLKKYFGICCLVLFIIFVIFMFGVKMEMRCRLAGMDGPFS